MMRLVVLIPAAVWLALIVAGAAALAVAKRHSDGYRGRHRAGLLSTYEMTSTLAVEPKLAAVLDEWTVELPAVEVEGPRGVRLPRPRSPWGTPEWVDEWTAEHEPYRAGVAA